MSINVLIIILLLFQSLSSYSLENHCPQVVKDKPYNSNFKGDLSTSVMTFDQANSYFIEVQKEKYGIPFRYVGDGCDMRSLLISKNLKDKFDISSFRVAIETKSGYFYQKTPHTDEGAVEFNRHTASGICVFNPKTKVVEPYVIDPAFFKKIVPYSEWEKQITQNGKVSSKSFYANIYSLDPRTKIKKYRSKELKETERLRVYFSNAVKRMDQTGEKPYGIGNARGGFPSDFNKKSNLFENQTTE